MLPVSQRYHHTLCHDRGPHEWSRRPSPSVSSYVSPSTTTVPVTAMCCSVWPRANVASGCSSPSSHSGSPPHGRPTARWVRSMVHGTRGLSANAWRGSAIWRRLVEQQHPAVVGDAVLDVGLDDLEAQPAGVVGGVAVDLRASCR